jgi:hypothetical protein
MAIYPPHTINNNQSDPLDILKKRTNQLKQDNLNLVTFLGDYITSPRNDYCPRT